MIARLGHEPITVKRLMPDQLTSADVLLVEPAAPLGAVLAQATHLATPSLPIICSSIAKPSTELAELDIQFSAVLVKPYAGKQLSVAIERALATRTARGDRPQSRSIPR